MKHLEVVAAVIISDGQFLCMQRGESSHAYVSKKYEFPGGKVETGEAPEKALERELREEMELDVVIRPEDHLITVEHTYPDFKMTMHCYACLLDHPAFHRLEHLSSCWLPLSRLDSLDWAAADRKVVSFLQENPRDAWKPHY